MKKLLLATLIIGMMVSCVEETTKDTNLANTKGISFYLEEVTFEGHQYLHSSQGGIIHSVSCKCKEGNK